MNNQQPGLIWGDDIYDLLDFDTANMTVMLTIGWRFFKPKWSIYGVSRRQWNYIIRVGATIKSDPDDSIYRITNKKGNFTHFFMEKEVFPLVTQLRHNQGD